MDGIDLINYLIDNKIITEGLTLHCKFSRTLSVNPQLEALILNATSFLEYDADIKTRLHCLIQDIDTQPKCATCNSILKMSLSGTRRYTFPTYCNSKCFSGADSVKMKRNATNIQKYGNVCAIRSTIVRDKIKQTNLEKYGVDNPFKSETIRDKIKQTNLEKYGSESSAKSPQIQEKRKATFIMKYGVDNPFKSDLIQEHIKQTNLEKYGVDNPFKHTDIQTKAKSIVQDKYKGYGFGSSLIKEKIQTTMQDRYGVDHALQHDEFNNKLRTTMQDRYGVEHALQHEEFKRTATNKRRSTLLKKYNNTSYSQSTIHPDSLSKLNDKNWLYNQHHVNQQTLKSISIQLGVAHSTIGLWFKRHDIDVIHINNSNEEQEIIDFVRSLTDKEIITNTKQIISPYELDIFVPELNLAIEYDGIFWHSENNGKDKTYHQNKTLLCNKQDIQLIHVFSSEWNIKQDIVKSRLKSAFNINDKLYARKCSIRRISSTDEQLFFDMNHLQGYSPSSVCYGLIYNNTIVAAMSFCKPRYNKKFEYELLRFSNITNTNVVGGASKLFKFFVKTHFPKTIISYCDLRWGTGNLYNMLGFSQCKNSSPNYFYFKNGSEKLESRIKFQKHKLNKQLNNFDSKLTEWENMRNNGYNRIWDCGNSVWSWEDTNHFHSPESISAS